MLKCNKCGQVIKQEDLGLQKGFIGYFGNEKCYETYADNCICGGEFEEAEECDSCGEYCIKTEITLGWRHNVQVCRGCIEGYKGKYEQAYNKLTMNDLDEFIDWLVDINEIIEP